MRAFTYRLLLPLIAATLLVVPQAEATSLLQMELGGLTARADRIFRGTVIDLEQGTVEAGGGELPAVTYRLRVEEIYKGDADLVEGDQQIIEIRMVGNIKAEEPSGDVQHFSIFRDVPKLQMGNDYLLFTTTPSVIGLSTTVGLGQGAFTVFLQEKEELTVNEFNNIGLGLDGAGPVPYSEITAKILTLLGQ
jgi:hypothetical protein